MKAYAIYFFEKKQDTDFTYNLVKTLGKADNVLLGKHADGTEFIRYGKPRIESIAKYFAYSFEIGNGNTLTSTEDFDSELRTFGDGKKVGTHDLIFIQLSKDKSRMVMWFIRDLGIDRERKQKAFKNWVNGEKIWYIGE